MRIPVVGGPHDGLTALAVRDGEFVWIDPAGRRRFKPVTRERLAARGQVLYQQSEGVYVYRGLQVAVCGNCGGFHDRPLFDQRCDLCGAALPTRGEGHGAGD